MRDLLYRLPRFSADFPVDIIVGEIALLGVCKNISENGMRGEFRHRLPVGTEGLIRLNHPQQSMEVTGKVAYFAQYQMAFHFLFKSEGERKKVAEFSRAVRLMGASLRMSALAARAGRYQPVIPPDRRLR